MRFVRTWVQRECRSRKVELKLGVASLHSREYTTNSSSKLSTVLPDRHIQSRLTAYNVPLRRFDAIEMLGYRHDVGKELVQLKKILRANGLDDQGICDSLEFS